VQVLPPDVNESGWKFTPVSGDAIRFGLGALRGLGSGAVNSILATRREGGPFRSLFDLADRVDLRLAGKRSLEALILSGACDALTSPPAHRSQLLEGWTLVVREAQLRHEERASGQASLFDMGPAEAAPERPEPQLPDVPRWAEAERLAREKEILGFFISGHPLERFSDEVRVFDQVNTAALKQYRDQKVELACVVTSVSRQISRKNGSEWGRLTVEDFYGTASVLAFGDVWEQYHDLLVPRTRRCCCGARFPAGTATRTRRRSSWTACRAAGPAPHQRRAGRSRSRWPPAPAPTRGPGGGRVPGAPGPGDAVRDDHTRRQRRHRDGAAALAQHHRDAERGTAGVAARPVRHRTDPAGTILRRGRA
jgi:DNA polymerase III alpha subunit